MKVYRKVCLDSIEITNYKIDVKLKWRELPTLPVRNWTDVNLPAQPAQEPVQCQVVQARHCRMLPFKVQKPK